jgi:hypothetical protein
MNDKTRAAMRAFGYAPADTHESDATPEPKPVPGFDGGVRGPAPVAPESHGAWLLRVIRGEPDVPADWPWPRG